LQKKLLLEWCVRDVELDPVPLPLQPVGASGASLLELFVCMPLQVDPSKIIWTPYDASHEYATFKS